MNNILAFTMMLCLFGCESFDSHKSNDSNIINNLDHHLTENADQNHEHNSLNSDSSVQNKEMNINKEKLIESCKKLIISNVLKNNTISFNKNIGSNYYINKNTGDVYLYLEFCAENEAGNAQEFKGKCIFFIDGQTQITISE